MPGLILTSSAVIRLAMACAGGADMDLDERFAFAKRLDAVAQVESGRMPYTIGVNSDRGMPAFSVSSDTPAEAAAKAATLLAQGRRIDLGLMQISDANLARHHLTLLSAFDQCANMTAGAAHLAADHEWVLAHRRYNCGRTDCGVQYASAVETLVTSPAYAAGVTARIRALDAVPAPPKEEPIGDPATIYAKPSHSGRDIVFSR